MLVITGLVLLVGTSMDVVPTILILTPVLMPAIKQANPNILWGCIHYHLCFWLTLTPPVGTVLNVAASTGKLIWNVSLKNMAYFSPLFSCALLIIFPNGFMEQLFF